MNRRSTLAVAAFFLSLGQDALAQQGTLKDRIVGTWTYVSVDIVGSDGKRVPLFGPDPRGLATFDGGGLAGAGGFASLGRFTRYSPVTGSRWSTLDASAAASSLIGFSTRSFDMSATAL